MGVDLVRYVMESVRANYPDADPDELIEHQAQALRAAGLAGG
jgi:hypothetical protein